MFKNVSVNRLNRDLSNATTFNPSHFSLVNTFNANPESNQIHCGAESKANAKNETIVKGTCIAGYALSRVIHPIQSEKFIWKP